MARPTQGRLVSLPGRLYNQGLAKAQTEDWRGAQQDLAVALALEPGLVAARVLLGKVLARLDRLEEAAQCWREALAQEPEHAGARAALGRAQEMLGQRRGQDHRGWGLTAALVLAAFLAGAAGMAAWQQTQPPPATALAARAGQPAAPPPAPTASAPTPASPDSPAAVEASALVVSGGQEYTVRPGDSLWGLARRFYGQGRAWGHIAQHNPDQVREPLAVGSRLVIPPHPRLGLRSQALSGETRPAAHGRLDRASGQP